MLNQWHEMVYATKSFKMLHCFNRSWIFSSYTRLLSLDDIHACRGPIKSFSILSQTLWLMKAYLSIIQQYLWKTFNNISTPFYCHSKFWMINLLYSIWSKNRPFQKSIRTKIHFWIIITNYSRWLIVKF